MAENTRRVYEIDVKYSTEALQALKELRDAAKGTEEAMKATKIAAEGLSGALGSASKSDRFLQYLRELSATVGLTQKQLLEYKAKQLEVAEAAQPLIDAYSKAKDAARQQADEAARNNEKLAAGATAIARYRQSGQDLVASLREQLAAFGKTGDSLLLYRAQLAGVQEPVRQLLAQINSLKDKQKEAADATADNARRQAESAANLQRFRDAGEQIVTSLREQIQGYGLTGDALVVLKARLAGVGPEAERLVVQLRALREAREAADRAQAAKDNETAKLRAQQQSAQAYTESLRDELASLELSKAGYEEYKARKLGAADATAGLRSAIAAARAELASEASDIAKVNAALQAGAQAVANYKSAGQDLIAKYQTKLATVGKTPEEQDRQSGVLLGVSDQLNPLIDKTQQLARDEAALKAQLEQLNAVFKANSDEVNRNREAAERLEQRLQQKISNFGKSQEEIDKETASLAGNRAAVDSLYKKLNDLETAELKRAAAVAQAKKETDAATVAEERRKNALDNLYKSAQRQIETHNLKPADIFTKDATALGGDPAKIKELAAGLREVEKNAEGASAGLLKQAFSTVGARRELLVLGHELSQGNFKQFGGSLLVLAERMDLTGTLFSRVALISGGVIGAFVAVAAAAVKGALDQQKLNNALFLTGSYSGQTAASFDGLAKRVHESAGITVGAANDITRGFIETGRFGPQSLESVSKAAANLSRVTGLSADDVVKQFEGMTRGAANWAKETNERYHFITLAQYEQIRALELSGRQQEAIGVAAEALTTHLDKQRESVGYITAAWRGFKDVLSSTVHFFEDIGKPDTAGQLFESARKGLEKTKAELEAAKAARAEFAVNPDPNNTGGRLGGSLATGGNDPERAYRERIKLLEIQLERFQKLTEQYGPLAKAERERAKDLADIAEKERLAIAASDDLSATIDQTKVGTRFEEWLKKYQRDKDAIIKEGHAIFTEDAKLLAGRSQVDEEGKVTGRYLPGPKLDTEIIESAKKQFGNKEDNALEKRIEDRIRAIGEENAAIEQQIREYASYGKSLNNAAEAKAKFDLESKKGNLYGATPEQADKVLEEARRNDALKAQQRDILSYKEAAKRIEQLKEEVSLRPKNAREQEIAIALGRLEGEVLDTTSEKYKAVALALRELINAKHDNQLANQLREDEERADKEAQAIERETNLIGANSLERQKAAVSEKILDEARKRKRDNPDNVSEIDASAARQIDVITAALERNYQEQRRFESGARIAFQNYKEAATDGARFAQDIIGGGLKKLEDALVTFWKTGKLNFKDLFQFMADEFLRQAARIQIKNLLEGLSKGEGGGIIGKVTDFLGRAFGNATGAKTNTDEDIRQSRQSTFRTSEIREQNRAEDPLARFANAQKAAEDALEKMRTGGIDPATNSLSTFKSGLDAASQALRDIARGGTGTGTGTGSTGSGSTGSTSGDLDATVKQLESGGRRFGSDGKILTSPAGAQGEYQVLPATARNPGFGVTPIKDDSADELARVGKDYIAAMEQRYHDITLALAAYNAGPGAVDEWIRKYGDPRTGAISREDFVKQIPYPETRDYVQRGTALYNAPVSYDQQRQSELRGYASDNSLRTTAATTVSEPVPVRVVSDSFDQTRNRSTVDRPLYEAPTASVDFTNSRAPGDVLRGPSFDDLSKATERTVYILNTEEARQSAQEKFRASEFKDYKNSSGSVPVEIADAARKDQELEEQQATKTLSSLNESLLPTDNSFKQLSNELPSTNVSLDQFKTAADAAAQSLQSIKPGAGDTASTDLIAATRDTEVTQRTQEDFRRSEIRTENRTDADAVPVRITRFDDEAKRDSAGLRGAKSPLEQAQGPILTTLRAVQDAKSGNVASLTRDFFKLFNLGSGGSNDIISPIRRLFGGGDAPKTPIDKASILDLFKTAPTAPAIPSPSDKNFGTGDFTKDELGKIFGPAEKSAEDFASAVEPASSALDLLPTSVDGTLTSFDGLGTSLGNTVDSFGGLDNSLTTAVDSFGGLDNSLSIVGDSFSNLDNSLGGIDDVFNGLGDSVSSLSDSFGNFDFGSLTDLFSGGGGGGGGGGFDLGDLGSLFGFAKGGVMSPKGATNAVFERGGVMTPYGEREPVLFARGGVMTPYGESKQIIVHEFAHGGVMAGDGYDEHKHKQSVLKLDRGGIMTPNGLADIAKFATGGVMTRWGKLEPEAYSTGGVARQPRLAVFGEGRNHEAYIPMEDNKNIRVQMRSVNGELKAYAPLPGGRSVPVKVEMQHNDFVSGQPFMKLPGGRRLPSFAYGGVMSPEDDYIKHFNEFASGGVMDGDTVALPLTRYAEGGVMAGDSVAFVPRADGGKGGQGVSGPVTKVNIHVENKAPGVRVTTEEKDNDNGGKDIKFIIEAAVAEVDRRIATGGSTNRVLRSKGVNLSRNLPPRS